MRSIPDICPHFVRLFESREVSADELQESGSKVEKLVKVTINDSQFAALISFVCDLGADALRMSVLLERINARRFHDASLEFRKWNHADGKELDSLLRRRLSEANLFCSFPEPVVTHQEMKTKRFRRESSMSGRRVA